MALFFYLVAILINIFAGVRYNKKNNRKVNPLIFFLSFIIIFLLMSGYRNTSGLSNDLLYDEMDYNNIINGLDSNYEIGYILLMKVGGIFTQDFYTFRSVIIGIFLFLLFWSIKKWAPSPHYVIALFSSYLVILSSEQLRFFLAFVIFEIGLNILIYSHYKHRKLIYSCFLLLASTIHSSFLIYFVFLLTNTSRRSKKEKIIASLTFLFCVVIFLNNNQIPGLSELLKSVDNYKINVYMSQSTRYGFIYPFILQLSSILLTLWAFKLSVESKNSEDITIIQRVYKLNLLAVIFFPLFMLQITFYRLARNILLINYYAYSQIRISKNININKRMLFVFIVWISVILWIVVDLIIKTPANSLLIPFFTENKYLS